jgi:hypothetical protein
VASTQPRPPRFQAELVEPLERVRADRLEHREARLAVGLLLLAEETVVDQRRESGQETAAAADRFGCFERAPGCEHCEPREKRLVVACPNLQA